MDKRMPRDTKGQFCVRSLTFTSIALATWRVYAVDMETGAARTFEARAFRATDAETDVEGLFGVVVVGSEKVGV